VSVEDGVALRQRARALGRLVGLERREAGAGEPAQRGRADGRPPSELPARLRPAHRQPRDRPGQRPPCDGRGFGHRALVARDRRRIDPNRDVDRARYRYLQMTKPDIVERLLRVEQAYAKVHQQLAQLQFRLLEQEHQRAEEQQQAHRQTKQKERNQ